ncbi:MAG TPA: hypothetical protein VLL75_14660, partial [Vicinamibacteria bacterium]|nr:hypothetical protein [Vicinamibacteria bacterium]
MSRLVAVAANTFRETVRERVGDRLRLEVDERDLGRTVAAVEAAGGRILSVQPVRQTLEDYFF